MKLLTLLLLLILAPGCLQAQVWWRQATFSDMGYDPKLENSK